jgi:hypothetical protein
MSNASDAKPETNSAEDFFERLGAIADEAKGYGYSTLIGVVDNDMMNATQEILVSWHGGWITCLGMAERARQVIGSGE